MADLRLIAVVAIAACSTADAQAPEPAAKPSGVHVPATWKPAPAIVEATRMAAGGTGITVDGIEAWGEPAMGCYALWLSLRGAGGGGDVLADQIVKSLEAEQLALRDVVKPTAAEGVLALRFERKGTSPYTGRLRARLAEGSITALACFANPREPAACETACTAVLGAIP
ncbi:MAG TPA: hypothetical protein VFQ53_38555 [Kofleriaceae bacterium]|nr:hypothetical protein [Kofleriaceae bacterium]